VQVQENEKEEDWDKDEEENGRLVTPSRASAFSTEHLRPLVRAVKC